MSAAAATWAASHPPPLVGADGIQASVPDSSSVAGTSLSISLSSLLSSTTNPSRFPCSSASDSLEISSGSMEPSDEATDDSLSSYSSDA